MKGTRRRAEIAIAEEKHEETLALSLVDGITCGLAAALLLLVMFGVNLAASTATLRGTSGHGTSSPEQGDVAAGEPVDIVIDIDDAENQVVPGQVTGWYGHPDRSHDTQAADLQLHKQIFARELPGDAFNSRKVKGWSAPPDFVRFTLAWKGSKPYPSGWIHVFRSGRHDDQRFSCDQSKVSYNIITGFDLVHGKASGDCM